MRKSKKILVFLTIFSIVFLPLNVYIAVDEEYEEYDDERAGVIENYIIEKNNDGNNTYTITGYDSPVYTNIIPGEIDGKIITRIADGAFKDLKQIAGQVKLPDSIVYIGEEAFSGCTSIVRVRFGENLEEIGNSCFSNCTNLNSITYNDKLKYIGDNVFENCRGFNGAYMQIPESVESIGNNVFASTSIDLIIFNSKNAPEIKENTFYRCRNLKIRTPNISEGYTDENNWPMDKVISTLFGDANNDGAVNSIDASLVIDRYKNNTIVEDDRYVIDMNYDRTVNSVDASIIIDMYKNNT